MSLFANEIQYLAHILSTTGIKSLPSKKETIKIMKPLRNAIQVWAFLALMGHDAYRVQLFPEHDGQELPVTFLSNTFRGMQWKWSTHKQVTYGVYPTLTK